MNIVAALKAWERRPGDEMAAKAMEEAAQAWAATHGGTATELRERIASCRREGRNVENVIA